MELQDLGVVSEPVIEPYEHLYFIEIVWVGHHTTRMLLSNTQLGSSFQEWETEYRSKAGTKPGWFNLGGLTFYSQNVISIELIETIEQEG